MELTRANCLALLATADVGRVLYTDRALPAAQPVRYWLDAGEVVFRTRPGSKLAAVITRNVVAFQVDEIDPGTHVGWSVCGVGAAYEILDPVRLHDLAASSGGPAERMRVAAIPLDRLSGQRLALTEGIV